MSLGLAVFTGSYESLVKLFIRGEFQSEFLMPQPLIPKKADASQAEASPVSAVKSRRRFSFSPFRKSTATVALKAGPQALGAVTPEPKAESKKTLPDFSKVHCLAANPVELESLMHAWQEARVLDEAELINAGIFPNSLNKFADMWTGFLPKLEGQIQQIFNITSFAYLTTIGDDDARLPEADKKLADWSLLYVPGMSNAWMWFHMAGAQVTVVMPALLLPENVLGAIPDLTFKFYKDPTEFNWSKIVRNPQVSTVISLSLNGGFCREACLSLLSPDEESKAYKNDQAFLRSRNFPGIGEYGYYDLATVIAFLKVVGSSVAEHKIQLDEAFKNCVIKFVSSYEKWKEKIWDQDDRQALEKLVVFCGQLYEGDLTQEKTAEKLRVATEREVARVCVLLGAQYFSWANIIPMMRDTFSLPWVSKDLAKTVLVSEGGSKDALGDCSEGDPEEVSAELLEPSFKARLKAAMFRATHDKALSAEVSFLAKLEDVPVNIKAPLIKLQLDLRNLLKQFRNILPWFVTRAEASEGYIELQQDRRGEVHEGCREDFKVESRFATNSFPVLSDGICDQARAALRLIKEWGQDIKILERHIEIHKANPSVPTVSAAFLRYCRAILGGDLAASYNAFTMLISQHPNWFAISKDVNYPQEIRLCIHKLLGYLRQSLHSYVERQEGGLVKLLFQGAVFVGQAAAFYGPPDRHPSSKGDGQVLVSAVRPK